MDASRRKFFVALIVILAVLVPLWPGFEQPAAPMDEGSLLVYPELVLHSKLPYRDFETFYGPANLWVLSATYSIFGPSIFVERSVGLAYRLLLLVAIFVLVQRWGTTLAAGCTLVTGFILLPSLLAAYAWMGGVACALFSIWLLSQPNSTRRAIFAGGLAGVALLFRADLGPAVLVSALPMLVLLNSRRRWLYLAGLAAALLPLGWLTIAAGPAEMLNNFFLYPVIYCSAARHLPISSAEKYIIYLFIAHIVAVTCNLVAGVLALRMNRGKTSAHLLLALALFGLGLTHQAAQRLDLVHGIFAAFVSLGVLPLSLFVIQSYFRETRSRPIEALLAVASVVVLVQAVIPELAFTLRGRVIAGLGVEPRTSIFITQHGRSFPVLSMPDALALGKMFNRLDSLSSPGDRLFVGPADLRRTNYNETFIYYMMPQLQPASYFLEMNPLSANRPDSRLAADVATADWLVLTHAFDSWEEPNDSVKFGSDAPMQVIKEQFELCGKYAGYDLYRRRRTVASKL
jgi:hypothetical protein